MDIVSEDIQVQPGYTPQTLERAHEVAKERGQICIPAEDNELQIDLDKGQINNVVLKTVLKLHHAEEVSRLETRSRTEGHKHIYIQTDIKLSPIQRSSIQAMVGSNPMREALCFGKHSPIVLFEQPEEALKVKQWRANLLFGV